MSHEIRTPMNGILGFSKLLGKSGKSEEKRNNYIKIIRTSGNQLLRIIDDILAAHLSKYYKSDRKIRGTVGKVIRNIACEGYAVIVGRGGVAITRDIANSLHINLEAPMEWRVLRVSEKHNLSIENCL